MNSKNLARQQGNSSLPAEWISKPDTNRITTFAHLTSDVVRREPSLARLLKERSYVEVKVALAKLISDTALFFNVGKPINLTQIGQTADMILDEFRQLKIADFQLCFHRAKAGYYNDGKVYDRLDPATFLDWVQQYAAERDQEMIEASYRQSQQHKEEAKQPLAIPQEQIDELKRHLTSAKRDKPVERKKTLAEELQLRWMDQFDKRVTKRPLRQIDQWTYQGKKQSKELVGRFVKRSGKILDREGFVKYKAEQTKRVLEYLSNR